MIIMKNFIKFILLLLISSLLFIDSNAKNIIDWGKAEDLYIYQCANCHRKNGNGIKNVYPPLKNSDYIQKQDNIELLRGMMFGRSGKIVVNGVTYQGVMITEVSKSLSNYDIGLILTYILQKMNGISRTVSETDVKEAKKAGKLPVHR